MNKSPITIGVSACLLGEEVRFNGGHKRDKYITHTLNQVFNFLPICPEVAIGLGIPRPPIRLVSKNKQHHAIGTTDATQDVTKDLKSYADNKWPEISHISGYLFKKGSPSCGIGGVKLYNEKGIPFDSTAGIYAARIMETNPHLPVEDEGRLCDAGLRENFIKRVLIYQRWQETTSSPNYSPKELIKFHQQHKFIIMSHSQAAYKKLGQLTSNLKKTTLQEISNQYITELTQALKTPATRKNHVNVLQHIQGYLKNHLDSKDKQELSELITQYHQEIIPLIVPITLLKHHFYRHPDPYIEDSLYLNPYPQILKLMNNI